MSSLRTQIRGAAALLVLLLIMGWGCESMAEVRVTGVRIGVDVNRTRVVLDMTGKVEPTLFTLPDPYRIVADFPGVEWRVPSEKGGTAQGMIRQFRFGQFRKNVSRLVLDLDRPAKILRTFVLPPQGPYQYRFVIDLQETTRKTFLAELNRPPTVSNGAAAPAVRAARQSARTSARPVIVIDAGHGGVDPGTVASNGIYEKSVTLAIAKSLKRQLDATGRYRARLTRDHDIFIALSKRVQIARAANADLFVSIHADALDNKRVRGATVYTLSETASDAEAAALAAKENRADIIAGVDLGGESDEVRTILIDLAQRETMNYSARFAAALVPEIGEVMILRRNSHRFAGFVVLKAPDVPSVLVEVGYLSNAQDLKFISSRDGQTTMARALRRAIDRYFDGIGT